MPSVARPSSGSGRDIVRDAFANDTGETAARNGEMCPRTSGASGPIPTDGLASLTFAAASNRITTAGFQYDAAGNQTQTVRVDGSLQRFQYDAANRLVKVFDGNGYTLQTVTYGATNARLIVQDGDNYRTYYAAGGIAEYTETPNNPTTPQWSKSYVYMGARLLTTFTPNGAGETVSYHHPDRLGTRLITDSASTATQEQVALPFGTALDGESTGASKKRFTSYDRSAMTGLDYAQNRTYDAQQGRFTQVDPIGRRATSLDNPQSLNMYAYCGNDPVNHTDPSGLIFGWLKRAFYGVVNALIRVVTTLLGLPTFTVSSRTPGFNPNASAVTFGGPSALNRSEVIRNLTNNSLPDYARSVYFGELGRRLTECINKIFNKNVPADQSRNGKAGLGKDLLKPVILKNAPTIIFEARASLGGTKPQDGINGSSRGVIRIDPSRIKDISDPATGRTISRFEVGQRTYVHELGNNLASRVVKFDHTDENLAKYGKDAPSLNLNYFGNQNDPGGRAESPKDTDTGAALERCVFGDVFP